MNCYIVEAGKMCDLPDGVNISNTIFYPEHKMTLRQLMTTCRPKYKHIVTDSPFLVPLYESKEVFVWRDGEWINAVDLNLKTYGTSYDIIMEEIWRFNNTIPMVIISAGNATNCMGSKIFKE
jgi:hypothetical protein